MATKRTNVIAVLAAKIAEAANIDAADVLTRAMLPSDLIGGSKIAIVRISEPTRRIDGDMKQQSLRVEIGVACRVDPSKAADQEEQLDDLFDAVVEQLEELEDGESSEGILTVLQEPEGAQWDFAVGDQMAIRTVSGSWTIEYERNLADTDDDP